MSISETQCLASDCEAVPLVDRHGELPRTRRRVVATITSTRFCLAAEVSRHRLGQRAAATTFQRRRALEHVRRFTILPSLPRPPPPKGIGWCRDKARGHVMIECAKRLVVAATVVLGVLAGGRLAAAGCPHGQRPMGRRCVEVEIPVNAELNARGDGWQCEPGYRKVGRGCRASPAAATPANADTVGDDLQDAWSAPRRGAAGVPAQLTPSSRSCCKVCRRGCPCGNSCISCSKTCHKGAGCAC